MSAHYTPGPWEVFICDDGGKWTGWPLCINAVNDEDKTVVRTGGQWPYEWGAATSQREAIANAHLIAAAPEMLEALREISQAYTAHGYSDAMDAVQDLKGIARAAIAKAEGRT